MKNYSGGGLKFKRTDEIDFSNTHFRTNCTVQYSVLQKYFTIYRCTVPGIYI
jgi:hypothetical protein